MKKLASILLTLAMILSLGALSACTNPSETSTSTASGSDTASSGSDTAATQTNDIQARLDKGEEVFIGFAMETVSNSFFLQQADFLKENFEKMGVTFEYVASEGDNALMISQIENFITMGADLIMCAPPSADAVQDVLLKAEAAGIPVIMMGQHPSYADQISGGTYLDWTQVGTEVADMVSAWITSRYPDAKDGEIHAAILTSNSQGVYVQQNEGMYAELAKDSRINIAYKNEGVDSIDEGYTAAQEALTMDPEIKVFIGFQESPAIGASNYVISRSDLNPDEFGAFAAGLQDMGTQQLELAKDGQSIYRGTIAYGTYGADDVEIPSAAGLFYVTRDVLLGTAQEMPYWSADDNWSINNFDYSFVLDNPLNDFLIDLYANTSDTSAASDTSASSAG
ncbi:MAG: sugar transporter substrate-binding protein [Oscillospiraceae bacterium]|nr:sugar transporter substrate-binding protein [Oscillospiraceae bacterium]